LAPKDKRPGSEGTRQSAEHTVDQIRETLQSPVPGTPKTPLDNFKQTISKVQEGIRQQQMSSEQQLQNTLNQASTTIADSQRIEQIFDLVQKIERQLRDGTEAVTRNPGQFKKQIEQLDNQVSTQQTKIDSQMAQALNQAVSSLAQAQTYMFQSQAFSQLSQQISQCKQILDQFYTPMETIE